MSVNPLSTQGIENLVSTYAQNEQSKTISPLETRKSKFSTLSSAWEDLSKKLDSFKTLLNDFKVSTSSSLFNSKKATLSSSSYFTVAAGKTATTGNYSVRVNQLAKSDLLVSNSLAYTTDTYDITNMSGTHKIKMQSGDYTSYVDVTFDDSENNQTIMQKISTAINSDKAVVNSSVDNKSNSFTGAGEFVVDLNGTETKIAYDYSNTSYDDVVADLKSKIGDIGGLTTSIDSTTGQLSISVDDSAKYISIKGSNDTGGALSFLGIDVTKEKSAAGISTASVFAPSTGNTKLSITSDSTGYDNRLILSDVTGSALSSVGITSSILSNRTVIADDNSAGFVYSANSTVDNQLNAKLNFNGINIQRNTNSITDLVGGVTFSLTGVMEASTKTVDVTVDSDTDTIKGKIQDFVKQYNSVYSTLKNRSTSDKYSRGVFTSDASAQSLLRTLTTTAMGKVSGASNSVFSRLSGLGITFDPETGLTVADESKLTKAITDNGSDVANLFYGSDGIATTLYKTTDSFLGSTGVIANVRNAYDKNIKYLSDKITSIQTRIDKNSDTLRNKYLTMQQQYATMINNQNTLNSLMGS